MADLPPSSSITRLSVLAQLAMIAAPTSGLPVKLTISTLGFSVSSMPVSALCPVMTLSTPVGRSLWATIFANKSAENGVSGDGFITTLFPAPMAARLL